MSRSEGQPDSARVGRTDGAGGSSTLPEYEPPVGAIEKALADVWSDLLGVERISRHDSFFELGGNSLLVVLMNERMQQLGLQINAPPFAVPILRELALTIEDGSSADPHPIPAQ